MTLFQDAEILMTEIGQPVLVLSDPLPEGDYEVALYRDRLEFYIDQELAGRVRWVPGTLIDWLSVNSSIGVSVSPAGLPEHVTHQARIRDKRFV